MHVLQRRVSKSVKNSVHHTGVTSAQVIELRDGRDHKTVRTEDTETDWRHLFHVTHCPVVDTGLRSAADLTPCGFDVSEAETATKHLSKESELDRLRHVLTYFRMVYFAASEIGSYWFIRGISLSRKRHGFLQRRLLSSNGRIRWKL